MADDIRGGIDRKKVTLILLFDLSEAFDTISPLRLLRKLRDLGFSRTALLGIKSYFIYNVGLREWKLKQVETLIPQRSVLGALLFSLYINDLKNLFDPRSVQRIFYADDLQTHIHTYNV